MKKGKVLLLVLAGIVTTGLLINSLMRYENTNKYGGELYILSNNAIDDSENNKIKVLKEYDFTLEEGVEPRENLIGQNGKIYLENRSVEGKILSTEEITLEEGRAKRTIVKNLDEESKINKFEIISRNYDFEDLGNGKWKVFSKEINREEIIDLYKFNKDRIIEKNLKGIEKYYVLDDYILFFIGRDFSNSNGDRENDSSFEKIIWYEFKSEEWNSIEVPKDYHFAWSGDPIGIVDNKVFMQGYDTKMQQFPSRIYSLDLDEGKLKEEVEFGGDDIGYYDSTFLNKEKVLFHMAKDSKEKLTMVDLRNKISTDLCNYNGVENLVSLNETIAPSGDKFFYASRNEDKLEIKVLKIGNNKIIAEGKVYEDIRDKSILTEEKRENYIGGITDILWSNDGKYLIIGEKENGSLKISNIKILELSQ